jgi:SAM-dependent methyltransferase
MSDHPGELIYNIEVFETSIDSLVLTGWVFHPSAPIVKLMLTDGAGLTHAIELAPGPDVVAVHGAAAERSRFHLALALTQPTVSTRLMLEATVQGRGEPVRVSVLAGFPEARDPYHLLYQEFISRINGMESPSVLEIGARARSGNVASSLFQGHVRYSGLDIVQGPNVHIVGDAHVLTQLVPPTSFDAVFSISVFEHLAMPWKVVLECNKVLKPGGVMFAATHQTWPLHDTPWDFWRFSSSAWSVLFNEATGFRVLKAVMGLPASIRPRVYENAATLGLAAQPAFLGTSVLAEKIGDTQLSWPVDLKTVVDGWYPA